jgi:ribosomal protein S18 acetylase RimI-like enzyme
VDDLDFDPATPDNTERLLALARSFHREDGHPLDGRGETAIAQLPGEELARCWLVRSQGSVIGYVVLTLGYSIEYGGRDAFIDDLYLVPEARGRGLGARVMDFVEEQALMLGVKALHLEVEIANDRAYGLYRRRGFAESGRRLLSKRLSG